MQNFRLSATEEPHNDIEIQQSTLLPQLKEKASSSGSITKRKKGPKPKLFKDERCKGN